MGSLYDIGNFRYRHFTFYSCDESQTCKSAPDITLGADNITVNDELINFLDRVWPHKGLFIGDSSEGDYSFVTYVTQGNITENDVTQERIKVQNIYIYKRVRSIDTSTSTPGVAPEYKLVWERVVEPQPTLKPGVSM